MKTIKKHRATKFSADIDRDLSDKLLINYVSAVVLAVVIAISIRSGIENQSLLSSLVALISIALQIRVVKAITRIRAVRKKFRSDPDQFRNESGFYNVPGVSRR